MIDHRAEWMNESRFSVPSDDGRRRRARKKSGSSKRPHDFTVLNTVSAIASPATLRWSVPEVATPVGLAWASTPEPRHSPCSEGRGSATPPRGTIGLEHANGNPWPPQVGRWFAVAGQCSCQIFLSDRPTAEPANVYPGAYWVS